MTKENSLYTRILTELLYNPVFLDEYEHLDIPLFLKILEKEGAEVFEKKGVLYWNKKTGFGLHTLTARLTVPVFFRETCSSTNDQARAEIKNSGIEKGVFVTRDQRSGRGRLGRSWISNQEDSLTCSLVSKPNVSMDGVARCSLVWMAEIAHRLDLFVKWPNDLVSASGKKIAGCLVELVDDAPTLIFGLGVNVHDEHPILSTASSLQIEGRVFSRADLLEMICDVVYNTSDFSLDRWRTRALYMGQKIRVRDIEGVMVGVREDGALLIDEHVIFTGDVELVEDRR